MPLTSLATVAPGDTITAARTNTERDNFLVLDGRTGGDPGAAGKVAVSDSSTTSSWQAGGPVPNGAILAFRTLAELTAAGSHWARETNLDGRIPIGAGTTFSVTFAENTAFGSSWSHSHTYSTTVSSSGGTAGTLSGTGSTTNAWGANPSGSLAVSGSVSVTSGATGGPSGTDNAQTATGGGTHGDATSAHTHPTLTGSGSFSGSGTFPGSLTVSIAAGQSVSVSVGGSLSVSASGTASGSTSSDIWLPPTRSVIFGRMTI